MGDNDVLGGMDTDSGVAQIARRTRIVWIGRQPTLWLLSRLGLPQPRRARCLHLAQLVVLLQL
jgi:hypothetical protein